VAAVRVTVFEDDAPLAVLAVVAEES